MSKRHIAISQDTLVPISLVITLIGVVWFGASVYAQVQSNTEKIETFLTSVEALNDKLTTTNNNVIKLNATLEARESGGQ